LLKMTKAGTAARDLRPFSIRSRVSHRKSQRGSHTSGFLCVSISTEGAVMWRLMRWKMCDYSLMTLSNRLPICGEELVVHQFETGVIGLASNSDVCNEQEQERCMDTTRGTLRRLLYFLSSPRPQSFPAVCIPPGSRLLLRDISEDLQKEIGLRGCIEEVVFTETSASSAFRDAVRFSNGKLLLLQKLALGQRIHVLSLDSEEEGEPNLARQYETH